MSDKIVRQATLREGPDYHDDALYMNLARECARCPQPYPCPSCATCDYNVANYNGGDVTRARLMRVANKPKQYPELEAYRAEQTKAHNGFIGGMMVIVAIILLVLGYGCVTQTAGMYELRQKLSAKPPQEGVFDEPVPVRSPNLSPYERQVEALVTATIAEVHRRIYDVNKDGLVNCIDYATMFYRLYPGSIIVYNEYIGPTGHLFNQVKLDNGNWFHIEPQTNTGVWTMWKVWPQYRAVEQYNIDATDVYGKSKG